MVKIMSVLSEIKWKARLVCGGVRWRAFSPSPSLFPSLLFLPSPISLPSPPRFACFQLIPLFLPQELIMYPLFIIFHNLFPSFLSYESRVLYPLDSFYLSTFFSLSPFFLSFIHLFSLSLKCSLLLLPPLSSILSSSFEFSLSRVLFLPLPLCFSFFE